jgi:Zn-finger nucleic acid-binding protein
MHETKECTHCGKKINVQYMVCPLCGGHLREEIRSLSPVCPRCQESLEILVSDGEEYDICPGCSGMWLDRTEFRTATRKHDIIKKSAVKGEYLKTPPSDPQEYIACVRCGKFMNRKNFGKISGVIIDECARHGVWLDSGEFEKIRHFIADGGLEKSRDRDIEKNRTEIRQLATKVNQTAFTQKLLHFWNFKRFLFS